MKAGEIFESTLALREAGRIVRHDRRRRVVSYWPGRSLMRIEDCAQIADRCVQHWIETSRGATFENMVSAKTDLVFVDDLFSFVIFTLAGWTCFNGVRQHFSRIAGNLELPEPKYEAEVAPKSGVIANMREFRNKAIAHQAVFEPGGESQATRDAYFDWNFGTPSGEMADLVMNHIDISLTYATGTRESSSQVKLPPLRELSLAVADEYRKASAEIAVVVSEIGGKMPIEQESALWEYVAFKNIKTAEYRISDPQ